MRLLGPGQDNYLLQPVQYTTVGREKFGIYVDALVRSPATFRNSLTLAFLVTRIRGSLLVQAS